jgi:Cu-Zn family superoxide dismutase
MNIRKSLLAGVMASSLALSGGLALAQDSATPSASPATGTHTVTLSTPDGKIAGTVQVLEGADGVTFVFESTVDSTLEPGTHGVHIHEVGSCDASGEKPYDSAGGHFNPEGHMHGAPDVDDSHAGDLGNIEVTEDGTYSHEITTDKVTLELGADNSLDDADGSALVLHEGEDDLETDPSGDSGGRVACGIVFPSTEPALNATPPTSASPVATPAD